MTYNDGTPHTERALHWVRSVVASFGQPLPDGSGWTVTESQAELNHRTGHSRRSGTVARNLRVLGPIVRSRRPLTIDRAALEVAEEQAELTHPNRRVEDRQNDVLGDLLAKALSCRPDTGSEAVAELSELVAALGRSRPLVEQLADSQGIQLPKLDRSAEVEGDSDNSERFLQVRGQLTVFEAEFALLGAALEEAAHNEADHLRAVYRQLEDLYDSFVRILAAHTGAGQ